MVRQDRSLNHLYLVPSSTEETPFDRALKRDGWLRQLQVVIAGANDVITKPNPQDKGLSAAYLLRDRAIAAAADREARLQRLWQLGGEDETTFPHFVELADMEAFTANASSDHKELYGRLSTLAIGHAEQQSEPIGNRTTPT